MIYEKRIFSIIGIKLFQFVHLL